MNDKARIARFYRGRGKLERHSRHNQKYQDEHNYPTNAVCDHAKPVAAKMLASPAVRGADEYIGNTAKVAMSYPVAGVRSNVALAG